MSTVLDDNYISLMRDTFDDAYKIMTVRIANKHLLRDSLLKTLRSIIKHKEDDTNKIVKSAFRKTYMQSFTHADSCRNNWPPLDENILRDPLRGHWDLWGVEQTGEEKFIARDPARDIEANVPVCIDFGTSSTVVALREAGKPRLLRIGVSDWLEQPKAAHFQNPTALELVNSENLFSAWNDEYYRPKVAWADLKCSHEARSGINPVYPVNRLNSIIADLKSWARRYKEPQEMRDQEGKTLMLALKPAEKTKIPQINPISLYAFHLGLALNNQYSQNGRIYHEYYLSFPATFGKDLRSQILDAFTTGLERSLPKSLGDQAEWRKKYPFRVQQGVDEPVAYAAAVLGEMELAEGDAHHFGVFDFGGGTTDFAFGIFREATPEEERRKGWEFALELLDVSGIAELGGEELLATLAHKVVCANLAAITPKKIPFAPMQGEFIPVGAEHVFGDGLMARSNTTRLMEQLRPFWEEEAFDEQDEGIVRVSLQSADAAQEISVELRIDKEAMQKLLEERIGKGVKAFFAASRQTFKRYEKNLSRLQILLAGNACRSPIVAKAFEHEIAIIAEKNNISPDLFCVAPLLLPNDSRPEAVTLKTGVALGQLNTVPGETMGVIPVPQIADPDKVFRYTFGTFRRNRLKPILTRFSKIGEWQSLGFVREDCRLIAGWSDSPVAVEGELGRDDSACHEITVDFEKEDSGKEVFVRAVGAKEVEIGVGEKIEQLESSEYRHYILNR